MRLKPLDSGYRLEALLRYPQVPPRRGVGALGVREEGRAANGLDQAVLLEGEEGVT